MIIKRHKKGVMSIISILFLLTLIFLNNLKIPIPILTSLAFASQSVLPERISYATHSIGTTNHAIGVALAKVASEHSKIIVVVSPTAGPVAWVPLMNKNGNPELGNASVLDAWWAYSGKITPRPLPEEPLGKKPFFEASPNLRVLFAGPKFSMGIVVRANSPFKTLKDMVGKRLGAPLGMPSSWAGVVADIYNAGLTVDKFIKVPVPDPASAVRALIEGRVDGAHNSVGAPIVREADAMIGVRFLPGSMNPEDIKRAQQVFPGGTYILQKTGPPGIKAEIPLWTYPILCLTSIHMPEEVAYELVKVWATYYNETWVLHPALKGWEPKDMVLKTIPVPYHNGSIRLFKEKGLWDSGMDKVQERLLKGEFPFLD